MINAFRVLVVMAAVLAIAFAAWFVLEVFVYSTHHAATSLGQPPVVEPL